MPPPIPPQVGSKSERLQLHQRNFPASTSNHPSRSIRSSSSSFVIPWSFTNYNFIILSLKTSQGSSSSYPSPPSPPITYSLIIMFRPENAFQVQFRSLAFLLRLLFFQQVGKDQLRINQLCKSPLQCNRVLTESIIYVIYLSVKSFFDSPLLQGQVMVIQLLYKAISCHPWKQRKRRRRKDGLIYFPNTIDRLLHHLK